MPSPIAAAADVTATNSIIRREFIVNSQGEDGYVEVKSSDTLADVRKLILEDLDHQQLPRKLSNSTENLEGNDNNNNDDHDLEFAFRVNGIRISAKQESRKLAFELLDRKVKVELVPKRINNKRAIEDVEGGDDINNAEEGNDTNKRAKLEGEFHHGAVTPFTTIAVGGGNIQPTAQQPPKEGEPNNNQ